MKTLQELLSDLSEDFKPSPKAVAAEALRKEVIKAYGDALKTDGLTKGAVQELKHLRKTLSATDYTSPFFLGVTFDTVIKSLRNRLKEIEEILDGDREERAKEKKARQMETTICELLSEKTPTRFVDFVKGKIEVPYTRNLRLPWVVRLEKILGAFSEWFQSIGGTKFHMIREFSDMVSCKDRAAWASYQGKAYRGVGRSPSKIKNLRFTGEVRKINGMEWLVAKGTYKSKYEAQSWTDEWETARKFAQSGTTKGVIGESISVVYETDLKRSDTLLSPDVIKKISQYGSAEREVIRVGNKPIPVTVLVDANSIALWVEEGRLLDGTRPFKNKEQVVKHIDGKATTLLGATGAKAFANTVDYRDLMKNATTVMSNIV